MSDTLLTSATFAPGILRNTTEYFAEGSYVDCDHTRFRNGRPEKIGGWASETVEQVEDATNNAFTGVTRDLMSWVDLSSDKFLLSASTEKLEILSDGQIYDVTPIRESPSLTDVITTVNTESDVSIADTAHNLTVGDWVYVNSQAVTPYQGIALSGAYAVTEVTDANNYKIETGTAATGSGTGGGALDIDYMIANGSVDNGNLTGWSGGTWDTPGSATATTYSLSNAITTTSGSSTLTITHNTHGRTIGEFIKVLSADTVDDINLDDTTSGIDITLSTDPITTNGTATVSISHTSHGLLVGNKIYVLSADPVDDIDISKNSSSDADYAEYTVASVTDANNYTFVAANGASGSSTGGGSTVKVRYPAKYSEDFEVLSTPTANTYTIKAKNNITLGESEATGSSGPTGNLSVTYGASGWNRPRAGVGGLNLRQWSLDNWGEDALACLRDGEMYFWDATNGVTTRMDDLTDLAEAATAGSGKFVPVDNKFMLVAQPSRFVVAFGSDIFDPAGLTWVQDPLIIRWAEQETYLNWEITDTNTAGEYRLPKGNQIIGAVQTRGEIVVFTDTDVYSMTFVGGTDIFQFEHLGSNVSSISQHSAVDVNGLVMWMGLDDFYIYDGTIRPIESTLDEAIFDQDGAYKLNNSQKEKVYAGVNKEFHEVWWFYPDNGNTENSRYVVYNYLEKTWYDGTLDRTAWIDRSIFDYAYSLDASGILYSHENGKDDDGAPLTAFLTTSYFDIEDGQNIMYIDRVLPDIKLPDNRSIDISILTKMYPHPTASITTKGPYSFDNTQNKISLRARGRQAAIKYEVNATGGDFEVGKVRLGVQPDGGR
jgi:hypothetical protein